MTPYNIQDPEPDNAYFAGDAHGIPSKHAELIGRFVIACCGMEVRTHIVARHLINGDDILSRMLIGEPRLGDLMNLVKRLAEYRSWPDFRKNDLNAVFKEISYLFSVRNIVAHRVPDWRSDRIRFNSGQKAKDIRDECKYCYYCSIEEIESATKFALMISNHIVWLGVDTASRRWDPHDSVHYANERASFRQTHALPTDPSQQCHKNSL